MTVGLRGFADSCCRAAVTFSDVAMFHFAVPSRGSSTTPPSPPVSPLLPAGVAAGGGFFRLDVATPPPAPRATSTPTPLPGPRSPCAPRGPASPPPVLLAVVADEDVPVHTVSRTFRTAEILDVQAASRQDARSHRSPLRLRISTDGHLDGVADAERTPRWVRHLQLADDCHSANVQLQQTEPGRCRVRAVRPLARGQDLRLWFADDMLAGLGLPFLAPHNIQGEKRYVCHHCGRSFEFPNPLKLHLALDCGRESVDELWRRLHRLGEDPEVSVRPRVDSSAFRPYWTTARSDTSTDSGLGRLGRLGGGVNGSHSSGDTSTDSGVAGLSRLGNSLNGSLGSGDTSTDSGVAGLSRLGNSLSFNGGGHAAPALFGAFHHWALSSPALRPGLPALPLPLPVHQHALLPRPLPPQPQAEPLGSGLGLGEGASAHQATYHQHASDMETLVSNLGRSKQGHLCIYCGKVYSRKYGLKIHIRTHTGFKPLKCKYCLRPFGDPSNLNKHVRLHAEGDTPYKCELCGKVLVRRRDLERHVKSRHQDGEGLADWDPDVESDDHDEPEEDDDVVVDVDVSDEVNTTEEKQDSLHCNGKSMRKQQRRAERGERPDFAIPTA